MLIRAGVTNALASRPDNPLLLDMARLLNHIEATARVRDLFADVSAFMHKFGVEYDGVPRLLDYDTLSFRISHMMEELDEYIGWAQHPDWRTSDKMSTKVELAMLTCRSVEGMQRIMRQEQFDALIDLVYVALQTAHKQGFDFHAGWERVHAANMAKEAHPEGKGGIRKPPGWVAPDLSDLV